jgi:hypothetical protein
MFLRTWVDATRIRVFSPILDTVSYFADRIANRKRLSSTTEP